MLTFIDTNTLPKKASAGHGDVVEVLNNALCGAQERARLGALAQSRRDI